CAGPRARRRGAGDHRHRAGAAHRRHRAGPGLRLLGPLPGRRLPAGRGGLRARMPRAGRGLALPRRAPARHAAPRRPAAPARRARRRPDPRLRGRAEGAAAHARAAALRLRHARHARLPARVGRAGRGVRERGARADRRGRARDRRREPAAREVAAMSALELRGLTKRYAGADRDALRDVSLRIEPGEIVGLVGGSGAGKSTLLRLIAGLETPTAGTILIDGRAVCDGRRSVPPEQRGIGLVFQDYALFPHLTVESNVAFGLHRVPRSRRRERVREVLDLVGLADLAGRYPHQLSGGQQQRAALARALAPDPAVLLLDEPFSSLDALLKPALRDEVARILRSAGTTTLVVVHDQEDVVSLADRVAILRDGGLWQVGAPRDVFA